MLLQVDNIFLLEPLDELIASQDLPENVSQFELHSQSFKKNFDKFYFYLKVSLRISWLILKKMPKDHIPGLYKKQDINPDLFMNIVKAIKAAGVQ